VTETRLEKGYGSMQSCWSNRSPIGKGIWVTAEELE
jgi:hypothetical protein